MFTNGNIYDFPSKFKLSVSLSAFLLHLCIYSRFCFNSVHFFRRKYNHASRTRTLSENTCKKPQASLRTLLYTFCWIFQVFLSIKRRFPWKTGSEYWIEWTTGRKDMTRDTIKNMEKINMSNFSVCFVIYEYYYLGIPTTNNTSRNSNFSLIGIFVDLQSNFLYYIYIYCFLISIFIHLYILIISYSAVI